MRWRRVSDWLARVPEAERPELRAGGAGAMQAALDTFERWLQRDLGVEAPPIALGRLLTQHPDALTHPEPLRNALAGAADPPPAMPVGADRTMVRQPLGRLPAVMRGTFWKKSWSWARPQPRPRPEPDFPAAVGPGPVTGSGDGSAGPGGSH